MTYFLLSAEEASNVISLIKNHCCLFWKRKATFDLICEWTGNTENSATLKEQRDCIKKVEKLGGEKTERAK